MGGPISFTTTAGRQPSPESALPLSERRYSNEPGYAGRDGRVRGFGGLMTVRDDRAMPCRPIDGQLDRDRRCVLLRIEPTSWERERHGDAQATVRKLRMLADTPNRHADAIQQREQT